MDSIPIVADVETDTKPAFQNKNNDADADNNNNDDDDDH